jgi:ferredoxin-thioredoxin reductase catalytic chain
MTETLTEEERLAQEELEGEILAWAKEYAEKHGYELNPDEKRLRVVIKGLARNLIKHGARYCPCRIRTGDQEKDRVIICPCIYHEKEIEEEGMCHCNLFFRKNESGALVRVDPGEKES